MKTYNEMFNIKSVAEGKIWTMEQELFKALVYVPNNDIPSEINLGVDTPYLIILPEKEMTETEAVSFAEEKGFAKIAARTGGSVVFVTPNCNGGWEKADTELFKELIACTKIGPVYEDGVLINADRFGNNPTKYMIRGAIFKTILYAFGKSADYIAANLLTTINGQYLWGPGEITPCAVSLERLNVMPVIDRPDIPIVSINNSDEIDNLLFEKCDNVYVEEEADYVCSYDEFLWEFKRWCGNLEEEPDYEDLDMICGYGVETVKTSPDNTGEFAGTSEHQVGYMVWYNKGLMEKGPAPTVIASHGGGDSCLYIAKVSGWWEIAHDYDFLLIAIENHTSVSATENMELIEKLKKKYNIDEKRLYATGFSMGGCKTWDFCQEYPEHFAALAPMDATFDRDMNFFGKPAFRVNREVEVPVFYAGGEITPLPELPFQAKKCVDRIKYVFDINKIVTQYDIEFEDKDSWANPIWGIDGDRVEKIYDESRDSTLTINYFTSTDGVERTALASVSGQGHECRKHTCEQAWLFMSKFTK